MKNENKFYESLEKIFVGAEIAGEGGYVNLLAIKSKYYKKILSIFKKDVDSNVIIQTFKEEFFDRLYSFFEKYFSECGSVYFAQTAFSKNVYEKVYTDNKDVVLFWKTNMLYYVKSDILFQNIDVAIKDEFGTEYKFFFDCEQLRNKQSNEKKELIFNYVKTEGGKYWFNVVYSERGRVNKTQEASKDSGVPEEILEKAYNSFKRQNTVDFFINKNAGNFLKEQLDMYLHQILLAEDNAFNQVRLDQLKTVKEFSIKIIEFISQFEEELVRIWNKPKFVLNSNYVITLNRLSKEMIDKVIKSDGYEKQIEEWKELKLVTEDFTSKSNIEEDYIRLPIDTIHFKNLELEILNTFENLEDSLDGYLIHSDNYQALNTLAVKYKDEIDNIYIDPPFNTGSDFVYIDKYQDSSWLTLMHNRLYLAQKLLAEEGSIFMHLDHFAEHRGRELLDILFGDVNFLNNIAWAYRSGGASDKKTLPYKHDSILFYAKNKNKFELIPIIERQYMEKSFMGAQKDTDGRYYTDTLMRDIVEGVIYDPTTKTSYNLRKVLNLSDEFYSFSNSQKPEGLIHLLTSMVNANKNKYFLDFFAGSGTSLAVAKKTGKKFIGVELGDHFYNFYEDIIKYKNTPTNRTKIYQDFFVKEAKEEGSVLSAVVYKVGLIGRMKEVISLLGRHEPCGISRTIDYGGGGFFKYYQLEQYEDTLRSMKYSEDAATIFDEKSPFANYMFQADSKLSDVLDVQLHSTEEDSIVNLDFDKLYPNIDFAETISLLKGKPIKKITAEGVLLEGEEKIIRTDYKNMTPIEKVEFVKMLKPLLWWGK